MGKRLSSAGRPRAGPRGSAVRGLPRVTVRAERQAVALWRALLAFETARGTPAFSMFHDIVKAAVNRLPAPKRAEVGRAARRLLRNQKRQKRS